MPAASNLPGRHDSPGTPVQPRQAGQRDLPEPDLPKRDLPERTDSRDQMAASSPTELRRRLGRLPDGHPSSPYHDDGSIRPPVADLREFESGSEPDEGKPDLAGAWRAALPRLQALWERHQERWPAEPRSPVDRSTEEEGSWRGDAGHYLNMEENLVAGHALDRVRAVEPEVSRTMKAVAAEVPGAGLVGRQNCLKGDDRFKEKVTDELRAKPGRSIDQIGNNLPDAMRYTYQFSSDRYADGYWEVGRQLRQSGYDIEFSRNSWEGVQYRGINTRWRHPAGQLVEVQFHTEESFSAKQLTHQAYERIRSSMTTDWEREDLYDFQSEVALSVPIPEGALAIPDYRKKES
jgi:hypothetical protein